MGRVGMILRWTLWQLVCLAALASAAVAAEEGSPVVPFDPLYAKAFAELTQASYCGADQRLKNWTCDACRAAGVHLVPGTVRFVEHREIVQPNSTFILVARLAVPATPSNDGCVVAFRGSHTLTNWIRDSEVWPKPVPFEWCDGCEVWAGYDNILKNVLPELTKTLSELGCVPQKQAHDVAPETTSNLYITGHSLGAAVSTLAMCLLGETGFKIKLSYNFESPRVGNAAFAAVFDKEFSRSIPMYRVTHARDPVVHLPPRPLFGYVHVSVEVWYDRNGKYTICAEGEDRRCSDRYNLLETMLFVGDHCHSPLVASGEICTCPLRGAGLEELGQRQAARDVHGDPTATVVVI